MSRIDRETVRHVALLARLEFSDEELDRFAHELGDILEYVAKLEGLDTTDVAPTSHSLPLANVMRDDVVKPSLPKEQALANAPDAEDGCFKVPQVIQDF
ncbi:MAG: Asp-tRNA(Asn)/Glu-tRNA(Gln) amidotransferase subunit GatC [Candidatus Sumerlaeaceae bacterium]|jgi:aspartyl-tRNA(Asn)/glutamyl-tRNA(Gln) amidotransferase subunit C